MKKLFAVLLVGLFVYGCGVPESMVGTAEEHKPPEAKPVAKETALRFPLSQLGEMTKVYGTKKLYVQCEQAGDVTGAGIASQAEIPIDITEMIKTAVNSVGGNVFYVPYNPNYILGQARTGYKEPKSKITPNVVVSAGITEFDRALVGTERGLDLTLPGSTVSGGLGGKSGDTLSQITLDMNLIDYDTMTMIPKMQAINTVTVARGKREAGIGIELFGAALGYTSGVKTVQGRHAAVRALVEMSVLEVLGRYLNIPYWRFIPGAQPDPLVVENLRISYSRTDYNGQILTVQKLLAMHGLKVEQTGVLDPPTEDALRKFKAKHMNIQDSRADEDTFLALYVNIPVRGAAAK